MWTKYFDEEAYSKGYQYFSEGRITHLEYDGKSLKARAIGSHTYYIVVYFNEDGDVDGMYCNCPHFQSGNMCKHLAGSLIALEDTLTEAPEVQQKKTFEEVFKEATESDMRDFLSSLFEDYPDLKDRMIIYLDDNYNFPSLTTYKNYIDQIVNNSEVRSFTKFHTGLVKLVRDLDEFYRDEVSLIITKKNYDLALDIIIHTIKTIDRLDINESDGEYTDLLLICESNLKKILDKIEGKQGIEYFHKLKSAIGNYSEIGIVPEFFAYALDLFDDEYLSEEKIGVYEEKYENSFNTYNNKTSIYLLKHRIKELANIYMKYEKYEDFEKLYRTWPDDRDLKHLMADLKLVNKDYEGALKVLKEGEGKEEARFRSKEFADRIKEIYRETNNHEKLLDKILQDLKTYRKITSVDYRFIKESISEEDFKILKTELLSGLIGDPEHIPILFEEKEYDILAKEDIVYLKKHKEVWDYMKEEYSEQLLNRFEKSILKNFEHASKRSFYKSCARRLFDIIDIPGGRQRAIDIGNKIKEFHPWRPAMKDEINKVLARI